MAANGYDGTVDIGVKLTPMDVQKTAKEQTEKLQGRVEAVLVEGVNEHDSSLLTGRMSNNTLVHFPGKEELIGNLVDVSLDECHGFYYMGHQV